MFLPIACHAVHKPRADARPLAGPSGFQPSGGLWMESVFNPKRQSFLSHFYTLRHSYVGTFPRRGHPYHNIASRLHARMGPGLPAFRERGQRGQGQSGLGKRGSQSAEKLRRAQSRRRFRLNNASANRSLSFSWHPVNYCRGTTHRALAAVLGASLCSEPRERGNDTSATYSMGCSIKSMDTRTYLYLFVAARRIAAVERIGRSRCPPVES